VLEEVPGVGPSRVKEILRHFGSVARVRAATEEQLAEVRGVGAATARAIIERLREGDAEPAAEADAGSQ
jgi:excinuclease ABC subunit C